MKPDSKVAVITGASSGIGVEIARQFAESGHHLYLLARREERLEILANQLRQSHSKIYYSKCDISDWQQVQTTFATIAKTFGNIDFLINNAGLSSDVNIHEARPDAFMSDLSVNVVGTYLCTMAAYPLMGNGGAIVNVSSIRGRIGTPTSSIGYAAAKAGVINLTQSFAKQLGPYKIRVNCIAPGAIYPTEMTTDWTEAILQEKIAETPRPDGGDAIMTTRCLTVEIFTDALAFARGSSTSAASRLSWLWSSSTTSSCVSSSSVLCTSPFITMPNSRSKSRTLSVGGQKRRRTNRDFKTRHQLTVKNAHLY